MSSVVLEGQGKKTDIEDLQNICSQIRRDILRMVHSPQSGHPGGSLGCTEFFVAMYYSVLNYNANKFTMDGKGEDVFFLSNGHISPVWYSVLARTGFFDTKELATFRKLNTRLQGHPATKEKLPGIRVASGSLGQGLSVAIGAALSKKLNNDKSFVYVLMGDGEIQEGQVWEAAMYASANNIDNLIATIDVNGQQIDGSTNEVLNMGDIAAKWKAFGWDVLKMDGNNIAQVIDVVGKARTECSGKGSPVVILMSTVMGKGVDFMEGTHKWHGVAPNDEQLNKALSQLKETLGDY